MSFSDHNLCELIHNITPVMDNQFFSQFSPIRPNSCESYPSFTVWSPDWTQVLTHPLVVGPMLQRWHNRVDPILSTRGRESRHRQGFPNTKCSMLNRDIHSVLTVELTLLIYHSVVHFGRHLRVSNVFLVSTQPDGAQTLVSHSHPSPSGPPTVLRFWRIL